MVPSKIHKTPFESLLTHFSYDINLVIHNTSVDRPKKSNNTAHLVLLVSFRTSGFLRSSPCLRKAKGSSRGTCASTELRPFLNTIHCSDYYALPLDRAAREQSPSPPAKGHISASSYHMFYRQALLAMPRLAKTHSEKPTSFSHFHLVLSRWMAFLIDQLMQAE